MKGLLLLLLAVPAPAQIDRQESNPFFQKLKAPWALYGAGKHQEAAAGFRAVLGEATAAGDRLAQAWCHYALGEIRKDKAEYPAAREEYTLALKLYQSLRQEVGGAFAISRLGDVEFFLGNMAAAREHYREALDVFRRFGFRREQAGMLGGLAMADDPDAEKLQEERLAIVHEIGDKRQEASTLHDMGDGLFVQGKFDSAQEHYTRAAALYQQIGDKTDLARVRTSEGRLHRAHGVPERSLDFYREALKLQEEVRDRQGQIQTIDAMAMAYDLMGQETHALELYKQALALAKATGSERIINFEAANVATGYIRMGKNHEAAEILEPIANLDHDHAHRRFGALSEAYYNLGRFRASFDAAVKSVEVARSHGDADYLPTALLHKANAESKLGQQDAALADAQECLHVIEEKRAHLVPRDFMKRGFAEATRYAFDVTIRLLSEARQHDRAVEVAEQARSRAFLDLLATREIQGARGDALSSLRQLRTQLAEQGQDPGSSKQWTSADPELRSLISVPAVPVAQLQAAARRLHSTILSYWVAPDSTYIWVVPAAGVIHFARSEISERQLKNKIKLLWSGVTGPSRGEPGATPPLPASPKPQVWKELYRALIRPVEKWLPSQPGSLLTIEGHGPLLMLPFAALEADTGQYLVERYTLHSVPAVSLLQFTERKRPETAGSAPKYLLVANPAALPDGPGGKPLPPLPGATSEISAIAHLMPAGSVTVLQDKNATEQRVTELAQRSSVIHLATHGVIREDDPLASFLALGRSGSGAAEDGVLTAQKVYGLDLHANLVFLSACRSGLGQISGDGINGLTRAFLYAGTPSVIASLWDVSDETAGRLVTGYYRAWLGGSDKARALRSAQLRLLRALRSGQVNIRTPYGNVALPEDPVFWASFVLQGEP